MKPKLIIASILFSVSATLSTHHKAQAAEYLTVCASSISDAKQIAYDQTGQSWSYSSWGSICGYRDGITLYYYAMYR